MIIMLVIIFVLKENLPMCSWGLKFEHSSPQFCVGYTTTFCRLTAIELNDI